MDGFIVVLCCMPGHVDFAASEAADTPIRQPVVHGNFL
jgi:hypothetical protein